MLDYFMEKKLKAKASITTEDDSEQPQGTCWIIIIKRVQVLQLLPMLLEVWVNFKIIFP